PSRGLLVSDYLRGTTPPQTYLRAVAQKMLDYPGLNLLVGDEHELWYLANRGSPEPQRLAPGVYGLSNHLLNTPWPKVRHGRDMLSSLMARKDDGSADEMF